jgi:hypothetical protein
VHRAYPAHRPGPDSRPPRRSRDQGPIAPTATRSGRTGPLASCRDPNRLGAVRHQPNALVIANASLVRPAACRWPASPSPSAATRIKESAWWPAPERALLVRECGRDTAAPFQARGACVLKGDPNQDARENPRLGGPWSHLTAYGEVPGRLPGSNLMPLGIWTGYGNLRPGHRVKRQTERPRTDKGREQGISMPLSLACGD